MTLLQRHGLLMKAVVPMHSTFVGDAMNHILEEPSSALTMTKESLQRRRIDYASHALPNRRLYVNMHLSTDRIMSGNADIVATHPALCVMEMFTFATVVMIEIRNGCGINVGGLDRQSWREYHVVGRGVPFPSQKDAINTQMDQILDASRFIAAFPVTLVILLSWRLLDQETLSSILVERKTSEVGRE